MLAPHHPSMAATHVVDPTSGETVPMLYARDVAAITSHQIALMAQSSTNCPKCNRSNKGNLHGNNTNRSSSDKGSHSNHTMGE